MTTAREAPLAEVTPDTGGQPAIEISGVGVLFRIPTDRIVSFKEYMIRRLTGGIQHRELWALDGVDLTVLSGEIFGIIGRNGAGKSTLLRIIARVLRPTAGRVVVRGTVAPLLELGAGFHPDLTGEENVFLNASLLGNPRLEIQRHFPSVIDFAELWEFVHVPVRNYSNGMLARLGFAVATMFRPDILILDEVLAVGDTRFQEKCLERIDDFRRRGTTVLLVSHSLETVESHCGRTLWLDRGRVRALGDSAAVISQYRDSFAEQQASSRSDP